MPVTNRHIVMLSGSARNARSIRRSPTGTHWNSVDTCRRSSADIDMRSKNTAAVTTNDEPIAAVAR